MSNKGRCFMLTINNPDAWLNPADWIGCLHAVWQLEMGENGTVHYQIYVNFNKVMGLNMVRRAIEPEQAHIAVRQGTKAQCLTYCTKAETRLEGPFWFPNEDSVRKHCGHETGQRTDLNALAEMVRAEWSDAQIAAAAPVHIIKHSKGIDALRLAYANPGRAGDVIDSVVYVGPSGTGKSYRLRQECPPGVDWFWVSPGKWFDGYQGQPGLVFDEFRDNWNTYSFMLKLLDLYPFMVERKGAHIQMRATRFRFSTNVHPKAWWNNRPGKPEWRDDPLRRRLKRVVLMDQIYVREDDVVDEADAWWEARIPRLRMDANAVPWMGLFGEQPNEHDV